MSKCCVNISLELTESDDHILAQMVKKYNIGFKQTCIENITEIPK